MSETCGGCVYDGEPLDGVDVEVRDDGRVTIGGPVVFAGYRLRPTSPPVRWSTAGTSRRTSAGWRPTGGSRCSAAPTT